EATDRLGWTEAVVVSRPLVPEILALRESLAAQGLTHVVLVGMGGSSLGAEVITATQGVDLTVLDSTDPGQVLAALRDRLERTVVVVSSKSGSTLETDSHRRSYEQAFTEAGIDPRQRFVVVTDPGSPLDRTAREAGYRVFNADPNVGGRFSALTAFGLVPSGLAGADIAELLDEAESEELNLAIDAPSNNGLILGAAIAGTRPRRDKLGIVADGTHILGFGDWAEQLVAESTGKRGTGILPVVLAPGAPELTAKLPDLQIVRLVGEADPDRHRDRLRAGEIVLSGTLGELLLVWEYAVAVAGHLLGIDPFDQPDVESAKSATRTLLEQPAAPTEPAFVEDGIEVRATDGLLGDRSTVASALDALTERVPADGYVAISAYANRLALPRLARLRDAIAAKTGRPATFGWGPRLLHSTGQYHKGGPATGVHLQMTADPAEDLDVPGRQFSYGSLIRAQAQGDAAVLADRGRPVLRLNLTDAGAADALLATVSSW
ncbi:MAG: glucose-6-phosphate isomerase, partial [Microbacteriaceae bacterium]|nr:glucose-6-phosphate isomerase [Microbacteriaceae bacterium]